MKTLVVVPAYNEEKNILAVIEELKCDLAEADILVVNDCSTDNTLNIIKGVDCIKYIDLPCNLGESGALQTGFKYAVNNMYDYVIQCDADGQHIASEAKKLYDLMLDENIDLIIGSRFLRDTNYKHSFFRKVGTNVFSTLNRMISKVAITDPTSGLRIIDRKLFTVFAGMVNYPEYPDANLIIELVFKGYRIKEEQVEMRERIYGDSQFRGLLKPIRYAFKILYAILLVCVKNISVKKRNEVCI